jgi:hypothetical protein
MLAALFNAFIGNNSDVQLWRSLYHLPNLLVPPSKVPLLDERVSQERDRQILSFFCMSGLQYYINISA